MVSWNCAPQFWIPGVDDACWFASGMHLYRFDLSGISRRRLAHESRKSHDEFIKYQVELETFVLSHNQTVLFLRFYQIIIKFQ